MGKIQHALMTRSITLAPLVGKKVKYKLGNMEHEDVLRHNPVLGLYFFMLNGSELDARVCEIISND